MEDIKISGKELEALNAEVESQKSAERLRIEKDIRDKIANEERQKALDEQNKRLLSDVEALKATQIANEQRLRDEFNKQLEEIKTQRQSITANDNPFNKPVGQPNGLNLNDTKVLDEIEERSRIEFLKKYRNVPEDFGKI